MGLGITHRTQCCFCITRMRQCYVISTLPILFKFRQANDCVAEVKVCRNMKDSTTTCTCTRHSFQFICSHQPEVIVER